MNLGFIKNAKISIKLTVIYAFIFSLVLLILSASVLYGVKYYLYFQGDKQVEGMKTIILNKVTSKNERVSVSDKELFSEVPPKENIFIRVVSESGRIINISDKFDYDIKITEHSNKLIYLEEKEKHMIYENVRLESSEYGVVYIQIIKDLGKENSFIKVLFLLMAIADFIGIIISILSGYIISKRMLKPIDNITKTAQSISIRNLKERIEIKGPEDELKRLANTFNDMIDRLESSFNKQTQFVADASHELRTPIAVIQGYANLLDRWGKDDREALEKSIQAIKLETSNMATLVEKLLFLAKGDSGTQKIKVNKFWLNELVNEVVKESKLIDQKHTISSNKNATVSVLADYKMLKQLLRIIMDNSIKFTPELGKIDLSTIMQGKVVKIIISDTGIGIPEDEIENIFNRFYCVDESRSKETGGSGIGLSIAKWIVDVHQGTINVESEEGKGTKIIVTLNLEE